MNPSDRIEELRIFSTLWTTPAKLVNLLDFKPEKVEYDHNTSSKM